MGLDGDELNAIVAYLEEPEMSSRSILRPSLTGCATPASMRRRLQRWLARTWATPRGLIGSLSTVDHKVVARRYLVTAFVFLCLGGLNAVVMRLQLSGPERGLIGPDLYNQLFTMHGVTMMFLFAVPVMQASGIYLVPLMVGTRNIAFPRLNAFSYWIYLSGGIFAWASFAAQHGAGCRLVRLCAAVRARNSRPASGPTSGRR